MDRRLFLKYAVAATAVAGSAFAGYELQSAPSKPSTETRITQTMTSQQSATPPTLNARFSYRTDQRTLKYIVPHSAEEIQFINETEVSPSSLPVSYEWSIDGNLVAKSTDYSCKLQETRTSGNPHGVRLTARSDLASSSTQGEIHVDPDALPAYPEKKLTIPVKGICYHLGDTSRPFHWPAPSSDEVEESFEVMKTELGCNGVRLIADNDEALVTYGYSALRMDFDVVGISPRYVQVTYDETIAKFRAFCQRLDKSDLKYDNRVVLFLGNELGMTTLGWGDPNHPTSTDRARLHELLKLLLDAVPVDFAGEVSYAKLSREDVDWNALDLDAVGSDEYWMCKDERDYTERLEGLKRFSKPVYVTEFGAATYRGVCGNGSGWAVYEGKEYDETDQATLVGRMIDCMNRAAVDGCFLYGFSERQKGVDPRGSPSITREGKRKLSFYLYKSYKRSS